MTRLPLFALVDGAVVDTSVCRSDVVRRMASDLVQFDAFRDERDSIRSLTWSGRYSPYDVMVLVDDARQVAMQEIVAREMGAP